MIPYLVRPLKFFIVFAPLVAYWYFQPTLIRIHGLSMGTSYTVQAYVSRWFSVDNLKEDIDNRLLEIDKSMSTWSQDSEISKFNNFYSLDNFTISNDFFNVLDKSFYIYNITNGFWDPTIEPILKIWGFSGNTSELSSKIDNKQIDTLLPQIGLDKVKIVSKNIISKKNKSVSINLSSIAKGYAVDEIAKLLDNKDIKSYFVEIGGEIFARNTKNDTKKWKIGISYPSANDIQKEIYHVVGLKNQAIATSGDYRNFIRLNNKNFSHIINPKTRAPVDNNITSVSVVAPNTMLADALATAFMIMGVEESIRLCESLDNVDVFLIIKDKNNIFSIAQSSGFSLNDISDE